MLSKTDAALDLQYGLDSAPVPIVRSLRIIVMECKGLKKMDFLGKNDVYVKLNVADQMQVRRVNGHPQPTPQPALPTGTHLN